MCKMIIHYRTYLQNGITNTLAMPNNFYITSNQIQTPFTCYFDIYSDKWVYYYSMVFKLKDTVPDVQDDHPLQPEHIFRMVLQTHLQCQIISITPATKYKHHSTAILIYIVTSGCTTTTAWFKKTHLFSVISLSWNYEEDPHWLNIAIDGSIGDN